MTAKTARVRRYAPSLGFFAGGAVLGAVLGRLLVTHPSDPVRVTFGFALVAFGVVALEVGLSRRRLGRGVRRAALLVVAGLGFAGSQNWFRGHVQYETHPTDFIHYFAGAKYLDSIGYDGLYDCAAAALEERGFQLSGDRIRNLTTNELESVPQRRGAMAQCRARFSAESWKQFSDDMEWQARRHGRKQFLRFVEDHGFNGTPSWAVLPKALISVTGTQLANSKWLVVLDALWIFAAAVLLYGAFGARAAAVALIFLAAHAPNRFDWWGGSLSRMDWWFYLALGLAMLRWRKLRVSGAALALAVGARIFPIFAAVAAALSLLGRGVRRLLVGASIAAVLAFAFSAALYRFPDVWIQFATNLRKHQTLSIYNHIGLSSLAAHRPETTIAALEARGVPDVVDAWIELHAETMKSQRWLGALAAIAFAGAWWAARRRLVPSELTALALVAVPLLLTLSNYYMATLAFLAVLSLRNRWIAVWICGAALASQILQAQGSVPDGFKIDSLFELLTAVDLILVAAVFATVLAPRRSLRT